MIIKITITNIKTNPKNGKPNATPGRPPEPNSPLDNDDDDHDDLPTSSSSLRCSSTVWMTMMTKMVTMLDRNHTSTSFRYDVLGSDDDDWLNRDDRTRSDVRDTMMRS